MSVSTITPSTLWDDVSGADDFVSMFDETSTELLALAESSGFEYVYASSSLSKPDGSEEDEDEDLEHELAVLAEDGETLGYVFESFDDPAVPTSTCPSPRLAELYAPPSASGPASPSSTAAAAATGLVSPLDIVLEAKLAASSVAVAPLPAHLALEAASSVLAHDAESIALLSSVTSSGLITPTATTLNLAEALSAFPSLTTPSRAASPVPSHELPSTVKQIASEMAEVAASLASPFDDAGIDDDVLLSSPSLAEAHAVALLHSDVLHLGVGAPELDFSTELDAELDIELDVNVVDDDEEDEDEDEDEDEFQKVVATPQPRKRKAPGSAGPTSSTKRARKVPGTSDDAVNASAKRKRSKNGGRRLRFGASKKGSGSGSSSKVATPAPEPQVEIQHSVAFQVEERVTARYDEDEDEEVDICG